VLGGIAERWPQADLQHLRNLRRNALKEREQNKPPRAYRELFRILRELEEGGAVADGDQQDIDGEEE
jgi:ribosome-associated protein